MGEPVLQNTMVYEYSMTMEKNKNDWY